MTLLQSRITALSLVSSLVVLIWIWPLLGVGAPTPPCACLQVHFLNIGQGDATFIETPDGIQMLIDGGADSAVLRELSQLMDPFDRAIDVVVATHPDLDHVGGLVDVLNRYEVGSVLMTENEHDTPAAAAFNEAVAAEGAVVTYADAGQQFEVIVFSPQGDERLWESNTASIVTQVRYGSTTFMLTGDAPAEIENYLVEVYGEVLRSDVLKLGHHGSKTSTSESFLDAVSPQYAVVSAGIGNRYGHPHQEVMARVFARNIQSFHTGTDDTVTFVSDGERVLKE